MALADLDTTLAELRAASERIGANLLELELDPGRELLEQVALEGESAARWSQASGALLELWRRHELLQELLQRAEAVRGGRGRLPADRLAELEELLRGRSIVLSTGPVAPERRALLDTSRANRRCTPRELLAQMAAAFDEANATLAALTAPWDALTPRLAHAGAALREATEQAAGAEPDTEALAGARRRHAELSALLAHDPLAVAPDAVAALEASVAASAGEARAIAELRARVDERLARARELLRAVEQAREEALSARERAVAKIVAPDVAEPPDAAGLAEGLAQVERLTATGRWRQAHEGLAHWTARADAVLEQARAAAAANRAPVEARNQLRGRLDAYRAKARALRLLETPAVAELHERAHRALFAAPTDLAQAEQLVARYQQALSTRPTTSEVAR
jgi:hypothetical protein